MAQTNSDNPNIVGIKHMAFAVRDAKAARATYARFLCVPDARIWSKRRDAASVPTCKPRR
jgi:hypothetical protein